MAKHKTCDICGSNLDSGERCDCSSSNMQGLIVIEQLPIITERLATVSARVDERLAHAQALVCTEDTAKEVKAIRAEFNIEFGEAEEQRKEIKRAVSAPYDAFESVYKQLISDKYKAADAALKAKIDSVEGEIKRHKREELAAYFEEYRISRNVDFVSMDIWSPNITLSVSPKKLKEEAKAYIDRICDDLALIETQEHKAEVLDEYRASLNVSRAVTTVTERHKRLAEQAQRNAEIEARKVAAAEALRRVEEAVPVPLAPPSVAPETPAPKLHKAAFSVVATEEKFTALVRFMRENGIEFKQIKLKNIDESVA